MADRIDALSGADTARYAKLTGGVLSEEDDPELSRIVREVAAQMHAPIALVSLVLGRTQFFRAQVGLPQDLAVSRGTDRDASFCQFVVRDGAPFEVEDAARDDRVPQDLVDRYGIRAYLGIPVRVGATVVGSLCAIDVAPRVFADHERTALAQLATRASDRLTVLARERADAPVLAALAARPALEEIRNRLTPLVLGLDAARIAVADLGPLRRLATSSASTTTELKQAAMALGDLEQSLEALSVNVRGITANVGALGRLLSPFGDSSLREVAEAAIQLAHHHTKRVGGVSLRGLPEGARVRISGRLGVSVLAATLSEVSRLARTPIDVEASVDGAVATLRIHAGLSPEQSETIASELWRLLREDAGIAIRGEGTALAVSLAVLE